LYSGASHFEGLNEFLTDLNFDIRDKEYFLSKKKYKSFSWGVEENALLDEIKLIPANQSSPSLFILYFSNTHSHYFNPYPEKYNRFNNLEEKGRYLNSLDYTLEIIQNIILEIESKSQETIYILTADHGESFGEFGFYRHDFSIYNSEILVPFIMAIPSKLHVQKFRNIGSIMDIFPTLIDLLDGQNISELYGQSLLKTDSAFSLQIKTWGGGNLKGIIQNNLKYIHNIQNNTIIQYDLEDNHIQEIQIQKKEWIKKINRQF
jgi:glucan phosphoethanolaminetransferase (alkaline phosphatase superfamily)